MNTVANASMAQQLVDSVVQLISLPEIFELTRCHHQYQLAHLNQTAARVFALANLLANIDSTRLDSTDILFTDLLEQLDISQDSLAEILVITEQQSEEVKSIFLG